NEGDVVYTADGEKHSIENIGEEDLEFVALVLYM
ncbi:cupin, partial [Clostridioides difficile]|nr:cupin [Clostridioides difficile]